MRCFAQIFSVFALLLGLSSCTVLRPIGVCDEFEGIDAAIDRSHVVSIFIVHGINGYSDNEPETIIRNLEQHLQLVPTGSEVVREIRGEAADSYYGCLHRADYDAPCEKTRVRIYALDWRPTTWMAKAPLRWMDDTECLNRQRVPLVRAAKRELINDGVADVALYMGGFGDEMRYPFAQSLHWIDEDNDPGAANEVVVICFSMGGILLMDTLDPAQANSSCSPPAPPVPHTVVESISQVYLLSNPFPLMELARTGCPEGVHYTFQDPKARHCGGHDFEQVPTESHTPAYWNWDNTSIGRFVAKKRETMPTFQVVSFSDPNDAFSYTPTCYNTFGEEGTLPLFATAGVRNVRIAWLGNFFNPIYPHSLYGRNCSVINMITHGNGK